MDSNTVNTTAPVSGLETFLVLVSWVRESTGGTGLPDFSWYVIPKPEKMYQINIKCTKLT
jgi:hypothetical protein